MFKGLEGRSAIVTGGATLIGAGVVRALHAAGVKVVVADIDAANGQALADSLGRRCALRAHRHHRRRAGAGLRGASGATQHGGVHFLVNLACSYVDDGFKSPRADWLTSFNVNVASAVAMLQAVHPHMVAAGRRGGGQFHEHLVARGADGALALSGEQGRDGAAHPQHGDGPGAPTASA
jgi:NAD(P)-dependent dehydrogenase (short-subunit alcohol dehydrogenase family)